VNLARLAVQGTKWNRVITNLQQGQIPCLPVKWPVISPRLRCNKLLMIKEKISNKICTLLVLSSFLLAQDSLSNGSNNVDQDVPAEKNGPGFVETTNRLPQLLKDVKILLTDAIIADAQGDTLEVIYNLDRIYELLSEADQLGEKTAEDKEEFDRFENALLDVVTQRLFTLEITGTPVAVAEARESLNGFMEPMEVEMGASKFIVVDDRDGHIPLVRNKAVDQFISYFQNKGRRQFEIWLDRYSKYGPMLKKILREYELPEELVYLAMIESGLNPKAYSRANAAGMWQFVYSTGKIYGLRRTWYVDERRDPEKSTHAAAKYLLDLYKEFDHWYLALAAYNGGPGRVQRSTRLHQTSDFWQLHSLPRDTRNYIPYYLSAAIICSNPKEYGFKTPKSKPLQYEYVEIDQSADLAVLARSAGVTLKTLKEYNPELRQSATPVDVTYRLRLPTGKKDKFLAEFNALPADQRFAPQHVVHKVRRGESLWTISKKYRVSIHDLAAVNKIRNRHRISVGQKLTIPVRRTSSGALLASSGPSGHKKIVYKVKRGDTLGHLAEDYNTLARFIRRWNKLEYGHYILPGQKLTLWIKDDVAQTDTQDNKGRVKITHTVKRGDTIGHIAENYRESSINILSWNKLRSRQNIYPGQKLILWIKNDTAQKVSRSSNRGKKVTYTVKRGDTIGHIADDYNSTTGKIRAWNNMQIGAYIRPGQKLTLWLESDQAKTSAKNSAEEVKIYYTVKRGDTLSKIAENHRVRMASILKWNKLNMSQTIFPGQKLAIWVKQG